MAKFIAIEVSNNASQYLNGEHLVSAEQVTAIEMKADQTVDIVLSNATTNHKRITITAQVDVNTTPANPNYTGNELEQAINYALTANPGGVKAKVFALKDADGKKVYFTDFQYS